MKPQRLFFIFIILCSVASVFYFDRFSIIGTDVSYYFDISYLISGGHKYLIDFFDYRIPVFPALLSPIFKIGLSDFAIRFITSVSTYSLYSLIIFFLSLFITKSEKKSGLVAIVTFLSIASRQFDTGREIEVPLFYHSLELIAVFLLLKIFLSSLTSKLKLKHHLLLVVSGIFSGLAFIGYQIHIVSPFLILGFFLFHVIKNGTRPGVKVGTIILVNYLFGFAIVGFIIFKIFFVGNSDFISKLHLWLFDVPKLFYLRANPVFNIARKIFATLHTGIAELRNIQLPLFWMVYVLAIPYFYKILIAKEQKEETIKNYLTTVYYANKDAALVICVALIMTITTTMLTGFGGVNHQAPFFTLYALLLAFLLGQINFKKHGHNYAVLIFIVLFMLPSFYSFAREEAILYKKSFSNRTEALLPEKIAQSIKKTGITKDDTVLILGGSPNVSRLVEYKLFMGLINDVFLYSLPKIHGAGYENVVYDKLKEVKVAYKLADYPNFLWTKENKSNQIYQYIENYLKTNFRVTSEIDAGTDNKIIIYQRLTSVKKQK